MSYTALYRKFRPASFDDVKGQEHIVTTLRNQIESRRIGHAYLFCGTRGTGKTTVAKIFAKAVNCETPVNGSPCGECAVCKAIASGSALNVAEIDAASNNGVDAIRNLIEEISYSPTIGRYKVYIIDEAHMISTQGANALLKTLEEPPEYVIFILATTDPQKLLNTILSRCQRYDFHRITIDTIRARLRTICDDEQLDVEDRALTYIAKMGDGSMRDAISLLDQCVAFNFGRKLTYDDALDVLGAVDTSVFDAMLRQLSASDVAGAVKTLGEVVDQGRDMSQFVVDLIWYMRCVMLYQTDEALAETIDIGSDDMDRLKETSGMLDRELVMKYIYALSDLQNQFRYSLQKRILLEIALIRMCNPVMLDEPARAVVISSDDAAAGDAARTPAPPVDAVPKAEFYMMKDEFSSRFRDMENAVRDLRSMRVAVTSEEVTPAPIPEALPEDVQAVKDNWMKILNRVENSLKEHLRSAKLSITPDNELLLLWDGTDNLRALAYSRFNDSEDGEANKRVLSEAIESVIHKKVNVIYKIETDPKRFVGDYPDLSGIVNYLIEDEDSEGYENEDGGNSAFHRSTEPTDDDDADTDYGTDKADADRQDSTDSEPADRFHESNDDEEETEDEDDRDPDEEDEDDDDDRDPDDYKDE